MPLFQYFGWVGSFRLAALLAANWCCSAPTNPAPRDVPLDQKINIRIHTDHKWPERVVFETTRSTLAQEAKAEPETDVGRSEAPAQAERQPFGAFAEMAPPVRPCFRPPCLAGQATEREASPTDKGAPAQNRSRSSITARATASLSPIRLTGREEKADAFAHERRQLTAQLFRALPHQSPHQHGKQN